MQKTHTLQFNSIVHSIVKCAGTIILVWCLHTLCYQKAYADTLPARIYFNHFNTDNSGLAYNKIDAIMEDSHGFIWIGTSAGLNRYDGKRFRTYNSANLGRYSAVVVSLYEDADNRIWVGTENGVVIYDYAKDSFTEFNLPSDKGTVIRGKSTVITGDKHGNIWLAVNEQGLFKYEPKTNRLINYFFSEKHRLPANIRSLTIESDVKVLAALYFNDVYECNLTTETITAYRDSGGQRPFHNDKVVSIIDSPYKTKYILSQRRGLLRMEQDGSLTSLMAPPADNFDPEKMYADTYHRLWMLTTTGVYCYNPADGTTVHYVHDSGDPYSLSDNYATSMLIDKSGGYWVGTKKAGLNYAGCNGLNFNKIYLSRFYDEHAVQIRDMFPDKSGNVWCATSNSGVMVIDHATGQMRQHADARLPKDVVTLCIEGHTLWIGGMTGIYKKNLDTNQVRKYERFNNREALTENKYFSLYVTSDRCVLLATPLGLYRYDRESDSFMPYPELTHCYILDIAEDYDGTLWLATNAHGLIHYNAKLGQVIDIYCANPEDDTCLPTNKLTGVTIDSKGVLWCTTFGNGFCRYDAGKNNFTTFTTSVNDNLSSDVTYKVLDDENHRLWIITAKGLVEFNPVDGKSRTFTTTDGLLTNDYVNSKIISGNDGQFYLSSAMGVVSFNPRNFNFSPATPRVFLTDLYVNNRRVSTGDDNGVLTQGLNFTDKITLDYNHNTISVAVSDFSSDFGGEGSSILYKLEGSDDNWRILSNDGVINYNNLPPGSYKLLFASRDKNNQIISVHAPLNIRIEPVFYKSRAAMIVYTILIIVLIIAGWGYLYYRQMRIERRKHEEYVRAREIESFNEKMAVFTTIVNRIKPALALIRNPLKNIIYHHSEDTELCDDLTVISNGADRLSQFFSDFSDFQLYRYSYILERRPINIGAKMIEFYAEEQQSAKTLFKVNEPTEPLWVNADDDGFARVISIVNDVFSTLDTDDVNISFNTVDNEVQIVYSGECNTLSDAAKTQLLKPNFLAVNNTDSPFSFASSKLPLAKVIVELHDGRFITDITDNVVHITISLPQYHQTADAVSADATSSADSVTASNSALVLIVERETNSMREAKERLRLHHNVISVQSPELAFEMLRQNKIDIIVSEYNLKGMSGIDFCNMVKRDAAFTVPVLLVSRYLSNSLRVSAMNAGVTMIVEEPYKVEYLEACVNSVLSRIDRHIDKQNTIDQGVESPQLTETDVNFIRNLDSVVMANISEADFDNDVLAQKMYTSKSTLTRRVKTILGTTPNEYIRHKRLLLASQMLTKPDCRINEVCYAVGFNTPSYFAKCFKQAYGLLPQEYRDQIVHTRDTEHCSDSNES